MRFAGAPNVGLVVVLVVVLVFVAIRSIRLIALWSRSFPVLLIETARNSCALASADANVVTQLANQIEAAINNPHVPFIVRWAKLYIRDRIELRQQS
jgi:flagellar motor component MotA